LLRAEQEGVNFKYKVRNPQLSSMGVIALDFPVAINKIFTLFSKEKEAIK
jgi:hypothetical protein